VGLFGADSEQIFPKIQTKVLQKSYRFIENGVLSSCRKNYKQIAGTEHERTDIEIQNLGYMLRDSSIPKYHLHNINI